VEIRKLKQLLSHSQIGRVIAERDEAQRQADALFSGLRAILSIVEPYESNCQGYDEYKLAIDAYQSLAEARKAKGETL
jgi:hypothetical protein